MMLKIFRFLFEIYFFVFPISAGWLTHRKIKGKDCKRALRITISSGVMLLITWFGVFMNESVEVRADYINKVKTYFGVESVNNVQ